MENEKNIYKDKENKYSHFFSWINSFEIPLCKSCSNINDLRDGNLFLELLKYYFNYNKMNQNYLSLINLSSNAENPFEKMNIIFHTISKIINNNKIKSRIEKFHDNINQFLKSDSLIMEFLIYIIYLFNRNKSYARINRMTKQERINKNNSCLQFKNNKIMNVGGKDCYKTKKINYNSIKKENKSIQIENNKNENKNNFLFYTSNKDNNIININDNMNYRFTNGINNLKEQKNNYISKEIKQYITKAKIVKYQSPYFNNYKEINNNIKKNINNKSEIYFNKEKSSIKERNQMNRNKEQDSKKINDKINDYYTIKNIINIKRKLKEDKEDKNDFQINKIKRSKLFKINENNKNISSKNISGEKNIYQILKLSNNKINNYIKKKYNEEKKEEDIEIKLNNNEDTMVTNKRIISHSRSNRFDKIRINQSKKEYLNKNFEEIKLDKLKRQASNPNKLNEKIKYINNDKLYINKPTQKSYSYFKYDYENNILENKINNTEEINDYKINFINNNHSIDIDKEKIIFWLIDLQLLKEEEINSIILPQLISDGKLLCELINACEKNDFKIEEISNDITIKENALMNIKKALEHLYNLDDFPKDNIKDYEPIFEIDNNVIWKLLNDLYNYYSNKDYKSIYYKEKKNKDILTDINNVNNIDNNEKLPKKKKSLMEMNDLYFNINNSIKNKTKTHKNISRKNNFFKNIRNNKEEDRRYNRTFYSVNNNPNYNYSHKNISLINDTENIMNNNFNHNHNKENNNEYIKLVNNAEKSKNYFYYVNALKHYFDKGRDPPKEIIRGDDLNNKNGRISYYSSDNCDSFFNNNNNLYFNYSNNIYFNKINKKSRHSYNPANIDYYKTNYVEVKKATNNIDDH